jgi:hypothetical protein
MSPEEVVREFFDCYTSGRPEDFEKVVTPDYLDYGHTPPGRGPAGARADYDHAVELVGGLIRYTVDALVADGGTVATAWTGRLPSGDDMRGLSLYQVAGGLIKSTRQTVIGDIPS